MHVICKTLGWMEISAFLVRRKSIRGNELDEETFDAICDARCKYLSDSLKRELSVFIFGYLHGLYGEGTSQGES